MYLSVYNIRMSIIGFGPVCTVLCSCHKEPLVEHPILIHWIGSCKYTKETGADKNQRLYRCYRTYQANVRGEITLDVTYNCTW